MLPAKSREHRLLVLENQARLAAAPRASEQPNPQGQLHIPLVVEVKASAAAKRRVRRGRRNSGADQPEIGGL